MAPLKKQRLSPAGVHILKDHYNHVNAHPDTNQCRELIAKIKAKTGEDYGLATCKTWFCKRRVTTPRNNEADAEPDAEYRPYKMPADRIDGVSSSVMKDLETLYNGTPMASQELVATWAKLLKIDPIALRFWVTSRRARERQLPSPAPTVSPEPSLAGSPPHSRYHNYPPVYLRPVDLPTPKLKIRLPSAQTAHRNALLLEIGHGIERVVNTPPSLSLSREELDRQFAPYEAKMRSFLEKVESGALQQDGWTPSMTERD